MIKNIKPRAPSFCPPTRVFTQPVTFNRNNMITCMASLLGQGIFFLVSHCMFPKDWNGPLAERTGRGEAQKKFIKAISDTAKDSRDFCGVGSFL